MIPAERARLEETIRPSRLQRWRAKLRPVRKMPAKALFRLARNRRRGLRRRKWANPLATDPQALIAVNLPESARRLWPGAADRDLWARAAKRWPQEHAEASRRARAAAEGRFDLLGSGEVSVLDDQGRIRWHEDFKAGAAFPAEPLYLDIPRTPPARGADIKVPWELSRFQHVFPWIWGGADRYADPFLGQWRDWTQANPLARGVNWTCAMEVALRAINWTAALACWARQWDDSTVRSLGAALADHGRFIRDNLEWSPVARTNHYFADIVGLAVIAAVLRGYPPARRWSDFARRELGREVLRQFAADGFDRECSTTYHRFMVELATLGELACRISGRGLPKRCRSRIAEAYRAMDVLSRPTGRMPLIGDNDSGKMFPMAWRADARVDHLRAVGRALLPEADLPPGPDSPELALLFGPEALSAEPVARQPLAQGAASIGSLPSSGLFVLGSGGDRLVVRCGPTGYRPVGGHAHMDQLSIDVLVDGRELIVDPGQYCYTARPDRSLYYRSTAAHNTVVVNDQSQTWADLARGGYCYSTTGDHKPRCKSFETRDGGGVFSGSHVGYRFIPGGGRHRRRVDYDARRRRWAVRDELDLRGKHACTWLFHLHPEVTVTRRAGAWVLAREGSFLTLRRTASDGQWGSVRTGWHAPAYGREVEAPVLVFRRETADLVREGFELQAGEGVE